VVFADNAPVQSESMRLLLTFLLTLTALSGRGQDRVRFLDGSSLQGRFLDFNSGRRVRWASSNAVDDLVFTPEGLHKIHLSRRYGDIPSGAYSARLTFFNGDILNGDVIEISGERLVFKSWFAGRLTGPRAALKSIWFLNHGNRPIYAGPHNGIGDWHENVPGAWIPTNNFLMAGPNAFIGRRFDLPDKARIQFQVAWRGAFNLNVSFYSSNFLGYDYNSRGYQMTLAMGYANLSRGGNAPGMTQLGSTGTPVHNGLRPVNYEIRVDKTKGIIALLMDGRLIKRWTDPAGFAGDESAISFLNRSQILLLGKFRLSEWDGGFEDTDEHSQTNVLAPTLKLVNHDTFTAQVLDLKDGRLRFDADGLKMAIPIARVRQLIFPEPVIKFAEQNEGAVQADLITDERMTLRELSYSPSQPAGAAFATGEAVLFGPMKLNPNWIIELTFNADQPPAPFVTPGVGPDGWYLLQ